MCIRDRYIYNSKNLQTNKILSDGKQTQYLYNANDYLIEVKDINGSIKYEYDDMGNLKVQTNPDGEKIEYSYDVLGNITLMETPNTSTKYEYDKLGRIKKATDKEGLNAAYVYDKVGNLLKEDKGNNTNTTYEYDNLYRLKKLTNKKNTGEIISSYEYTVNNNGIRTKIVDDKGKIIDYSYDKVGKLLKESIRENGQLTDTSYDYDKVGNRLKKTTGSEIISYVYDSNNKLLTEGNISYTYDCGNLIKKESPSEKIEYTYNLDGKLSNTKKTVGATVTNESYYYNALGTRIKKVTNGLEEKYLVDENTSYSRVLEEKDNKLIASYLYGNELISQNRSNIKSYYNRDGLGSTVSLCNSTGNVTDTYKYDGFGNLKVSTGTTKNNYLFAGEEFDKTTGYYNLRARYMDPSTGRFTGMDKYLGRIDDPVSLHKYLYANANPVNYTDPSGYFTLQELMESILSESALDSVSMIKYNIIGLNMKLELTLAGRLVLEISQESVEMMLEGSISLEGVKLSCVEVAYGMAGSEEDLSGKRNRGTKGGAKTGPKAFGTGPHNEKIAEVAGQVTDGRIIAGGQMLPEKAIPTPNGLKGSRHPDILVERPDGSIYGINVGKTTKSGAPIKREMNAINDLEDSDIPMYFVSYFKR
jgi:RHS repeat-associated protein